MKGFKMFYVNVYEIGQAYGGPEEGGWYYDVGKPIKCLGGYSSRDVAKDKAVRVDRNKFSEGCDEYKMGYGPWDGCDDDGNPDDAYLTRGGEWGESEVAVYVEEHPPRIFPQERPYYE
tara:strand:- start:83 stop:436 length:354 start_codon:yes stop_codon:yes gene_type:complete